MSNPSLKSVEIPQEVKQMSVEDLDVIVRHGPFLSRHIPRTVKEVFEDQKAAVDALDELCRRANAGSLRVGEEQSSNVRQEPTSCTEEAALLEELAACSASDVRKMVNMAVNGMIGLATMGSNDDDGWKKLCAIYETRLDELSRRASALSSTQSQLGELREALKWATEVGKSITWSTKDGESFEEKLLRAYQEGKQS